MNAIRLLLVGVGSVVGGLLITSAMVWLFDFQLADRDMIAQFPETWTVFDVLVNGCAVMMFVGATRAIYVAMTRQLSGKPDLPPHQ